MLEWHSNKVFSSLAMILAQIPNPAILSSIPYQTSPFSLTFSLKFNCARLSTLWTCAKLQRSPLNVRTDPLLDFHSVDAEPDLIGLGSSREVLESALMQGCIYPARAYHFLGMDATWVSVA
jgi:hypothetical protein